MDSLNFNTYFDYKYSKVYGALYGYNKYVLNNMESKQFYLCEVEVKSPFYVLIKRSGKEDNLMKNIIIKHHSNEVEAYYLSAKDSADKKYRSIAIKVHEILDLPFEDIEMNTELVRRVFGQLKRVKEGKGLYANVKFTHGTVIEAVFAYIVDNHNYFYIRMQEAFKDGIGKYEIHRMLNDYASDSVFWTLKNTHREVHKPYYRVIYHEANYFVPKKYTNKKDIQKVFNLSKNEFKKALIKGEFDFNGKTVYLKVIPSRIEPSISKYSEPYKETLATAQAKLEWYKDNPIKKQEILSEIHRLEIVIKDYEALVERDKKHSERMNLFRGKSAEILWNQKANQLRDNFKKLNMR